MSSPIAVSKVQYLCFWIQNFQLKHTQQQNIKSTKGKIADNVKLKYFSRICLYLQCVSQLSVCSTKHCFGHGFSDLLVFFSINHETIRNIVFFLENKQSNQQTNKHQQKRSCEVNSRGLINFIFSTEIRANKNLYSADI